MSQREPKDTGVGSRAELVGKALICVGATMFAVPLWIELTIPAILGTLDRTNRPDWADIVVGSSALPLVVGLFVVTLGSGQRLSPHNIAKRLFEFPCWMPVSAALAGFVLACLFFHARGS